MDYRELHQPVLLEETLCALAPKGGDRYLDVTGGAGSHANAIISSSSDVEATIVDRDVSAVKLLKKRFESLDNVQIHHSTMADFTKSAQKLGKQYDMILADLGLSSMQLEIGRGFSYNDKQARLGMDMGLTTVAAEQVVNDYPARELQRVLERYGEIGNAYKLAQTIASARPIEKIDQLVDCLSRSYRGPREGRSRYLARIFQAIRIEVNDELGQLQVLLDGLNDLVSPGGRVAVITFHSLEDDMIKQSFKHLTKDTVFGGWSLIEPYPIRGRAHDTNPRARSSVLRAAMKK